MQLDVVFMCIRVCNLDRVKRVHAYIHTYLCGMWEGGGRREGACGGENP